MKETLKTMKHMLIEATYEQVKNLECANYKELGEAIDMIKDIEETLYYCAVIEAMESGEEKRTWWKPEMETSHMTEMNKTVQNNGTSPAQIIK